MLLARQMKLIKQALFGKKNEIKQGCGGRNFRFCFFVDK